MAEGGGGAGLGPGPSRRPPRLRASDRRRHILGRTVLGAGAWEAMEDMVSTRYELSLQREAIQGHR